MLAEAIDELDREVSVEPSAASSSSAIATRFDKTATSYRGLVDLATLLLWL